jgi:CBS-domain-containing membrane protein
MQGRRISDVLKASDIMNRDIVSVPPEMTVVNLGRFFIDHELSGAPVIDRDGTLIGIVTENDLISRSKRLHLPTVLRVFDAFIPLGGYAEMEAEIKKMAASSVADICTRDVSTITEETSVEDMATIMIERGLHHLPVLREGKVVGMVGKHDLIRGMARDSSDEEPR